MAQGKRARVQVAVTIPLSFVGQDLKMLVRVAEVAPARRERGEEHVK
jgi:hypothetical protein